MIAYGVFVFFYYLGSPDRAVEYVGGYIALTLGAFLILIGIIVQGFRRLERLIIYRDIEAVEADGLMGNVWDNSATRKAHLKNERK